MASTRPEPASDPQADGGSSPAEQAANLSLGHWLARTRTPRVVEPWAPGLACFRLDFRERLFRRNYRDPVLISCVRTGRPRAAIAQAVNDLAVTGGEAMFVIGRPMPGQTPQENQAVMTEAAQACAEAGCALLGAEEFLAGDAAVSRAVTAVPPGAEFMAFVLGVCEARRRIDGRRVEAGDALVTLPVDPGAAAAPIYARAVAAVLRHYRVKQIVTAMAHSPGGKACGGLEAVMPRNLRAEWAGPVKAGLVMAVRPAFAESVLHQLRRAGEDPQMVGKVVAGPAGG